MATGTQPNDQEHADKDEALVIKVTDNQDLDPDEAPDDKFEEEKVPEIRVAINKQDVDMIGDQEVESPAEQPQNEEEDDYCPTPKNDRLKNHPDTESRASRASKQSKSSWPLLQQQLLLFDRLNNCKK